MPVHTTSLPSDAPTDQPGSEGRPVGGRLDVAIGAKISSYRELRRMSVAELARCVDISGALVTQIERGERRASPDTLFAIAEALRVRLAHLFAAATTPAYAQDGVATGCPAPAAEAGQPA